MDFVVKGDTTTLIHCDGGLDAVGIGTASPDTTYTMTVAATGALGIKSLGSIAVTGAISATTNASITGDLTVTSRLFFDDAIATALVGGASAGGSAINIPITDLVTHLAPGADPHHYDMDNGAAGQVKILINTHATRVCSIVPDTAHGTTITLQGMESAILMYTGTLGWAVIGGYGPAVA